MSNRLSLSEETMWLTMAGKLFSLTRTLSKVHARVVSVYMYCYQCHMFTHADILVGLLRLRKCSGETFRPELKRGVSVVRELHVYGSVVPINARDPSKFQHQVHVCHTMYFYTYIILIIMCMCVYMCSHVVNVTQLTCIITHVMVTKGFGMMLMEEAERIAVEEHNSHKISVISGTCTCTCNVALSSRLVY